MRLDLGRSHKKLSAFNNALLMALAASALQRRRQSLKNRIKVKTRASNVPEGRDE
jgi:hypothetical protein